MPDKLTVQCPTCYKTVIWQESSFYRPFCSIRCRLIDLDGWTSEEKRIINQKSV
ncbi:MAG: DNA gyrase inhibitor YacG [Candidatus Arsenophonus melophagi]|nr:DNA gyrase inhibitor YacG [Candidatus Arsenophonus melophagi]